MTTFKIKPFPKKPWYVLVHLFPSAKELYAHIDELPDYKGRGIHCQGLATTGRYYCNGKLSRQVGVVFMHDRFSGSGVVAHELLHVALGMMKLTELQKIILGRTGSCKSKFVGKSEEKLCHVMGHLVSSYWKQWYKTHEVDSKGDVVK